MLKRRSIFVGIVTILCLVSFMGAQEKKETSKIELIPVYEKSFDDTIVDVIFDTAAVSVEEAKSLGWKGLEDKRAKEKTIITFPKVIVKKGKIEFSDEKGKIKKVYSLAPLKGQVDRITVNFSKNRKYIGVVKSRKEFTMLNDEGDILWQTDISRVGYGWPHISPDGQYIISVGDMTGDFSDYYPSIYNKDGFVKGLVKEDERTKYELLDLDFTENGELFAVLLEKKGKESYKFNKGYERDTWLYLINQNGKEIFKKRIGKGLGRNVSISGEGNYIAVSLRLTGSASQELYLYNKQGLILWKSEIGSGQVYCIFSGDELSLTVCCGWAFLCRYGIQTEKKLWSYQGKGVFRTVLPDSREKLFTVIGFNKETNNKRPNDFLYIFDKYGNLVLQNVFSPGSLFTKYPSPYIPLPGHYPTVLTNSDNIVFFDGIGNKIISLKVEEMEGK